jgi:hypothetical protein
MKQIGRPASVAEITEIVGPLDDAVLMRIVETEATPAEVLEAFTWATADDQTAPSWSTGRAAPSPEFTRSSNARNRSPTSAGELALPASIPWRFPDRGPRPERVP